MIRRLAPASLVFALVACGVPPNPDEEVAEPVVPAATATDPTPDVAPGNEPLVLAPEAFDGIVIGVPHAEITDRLTAGTAEVDGIERGVHFINSRGYGQVGYATLGAGGERAVESITVTSPEARTPRGLGVGATLATLRAVYAGAEATEVDGGVGLEAGGLTWLLNAETVADVTGGTSVRAVVVE